MRRRWFGATGRQVAEVTLEGEIDLDGVLVVDDVRDVEALHEAHARGVPVVVRAQNASSVREALARPEVACVVVNDPVLLDLDLAELTYGPA